MRNISKLLFLKNKMASIVQFNKNKISDGKTEPEKGKKILL